VEDNRFQFVLGQEKENAIEATYSAWNRQTVTFTCFKYSALCYIVWYQNSTIKIRYGYYVDQDYILPFKSSDKVLLGGPGGFKGKILKFQIFNPGSQRVFVRKCFSF